MKNMVLTALMLIAPASAFAAGAYDTVSISTATGKQTKKMAGIFSVASTSVNINSPTIKLDGSSGGIDGSSITVTYGVKAGSVAVTGAEGYITCQSSLTASAFWGDGSKLTGIVSTSAFQAGDILLGAATHTLDLARIALETSTGTLQAQDLILGGYINSTGSALTSEIAARISQDNIIGASTNTLRVDFSASTGTLLGYINSTSSALTSEIARATLRENDIGTATGTITGWVNSTGSALTSEIANRIAQDNTIGASTKTLTDWVNSTGSALTSEIANRIAQDNTIGTSTNTLRVDFIAADVQIGASTKTLTDLANTKENAGVAASSVTTHNADAAAHSAGITGNSATTTRALAGGVDFSTITTVLNDLYSVKLSTGVGVPSALVNLSTVTAALSGKVAKAGDTMTGELDIDRSDAGAGTVGLIVTGNDVGGSGAGIVINPNHSGNKGVTIRDAGGGYDAVYTDGADSKLTVASKAGMEITGAAGATVAYGVLAGSLTIVGPLGYIAGQSSITGASFWGDASHLTGAIDSTKVLKAGDTMTGILGMTNVAINLTGASGVILGKSSITAEGFFGPGSGLSALNATNVSAGILAVARGGTGGTDAATARSNLSVPSTTGDGASGSWGISVTGNAANVTGTIAVANGGTGATDAATARTNIVVPSTTGGSASGTWSINVTGSAATATDATKVAKAGDTMTGDLTLAKPTFTKLIIAPTSDVSNVGNAGYVRVDASGSSSYFGKDNNKGGSNGSFFASGSVSSATVISAYNSLAPILFGHNTPEFSIANGGNVGIGTTVAAQSLDVRGNIVGNSSVTASAFFGNTATLSQTGAAQYSLTTSSGINVLDGKLTLGANSMIVWPDGTISTSASAGSPGGQATLSGNNAFSGKNSFSGASTFTGTAYFQDGTGINNSNGNSLNNAGQWVWAKSVDGATQSSGCVMAVSVSGANPDSFLTATSTTSTLAIGSSNAGAGIAGILMNTCVPGEICKFGIAGVYRVATNDPGGQYPAMANQARCGVGYVGSADMSIMIGSWLGPPAGGFGWLKLGR